MIRRQSLTPKMKVTPVKQKLPRLSAAKNSPMAKSMVNMLNMLNLPCVKSMAARIDLEQKMPPNQHFKFARVCGNLARENEVTKPPSICSSFGVQTNIVPQWTRSAGQWGMSRALMDQSEGVGQERPDGQRLEYPCEESFKLKPRKI